MPTAEDRGRLLSFSASGLPGSRDYSLRLDRQAIIIVGPNGTGKSTFLSLFYLMISRQWHRLNEYDFDRLVLTHSRGEIILSRADLLTFDSAAPRRSVNERYVSRLYEQNAMDLVYKQNLSKEERDRLAGVVGVPASQLSSFRRYFQTEFGFAKRGFEVDQEIQALSLGMILFLPTYRRIEKDIKSVFPEIEARIRSRIEEGQTGMRVGEGFREIASFGMSDIQKMMNDYAVDVADYRRRASESASQEYIRDIVSGKIKGYSLTNLRRMSEEDFEEFKDSLDDNQFSAADRRNLRAKMDSMRAKHAGQPNAEYRYLGMFIEKLLAAHQLIKERERPLRTFVNTLTRYLKPDKRAMLKGHQISIVSSINEEEVISLDKLSSGEKQIVSTFAYLLLSGRDDFILLIDEPELSLSVPWQKRFVPDIIETGNCAQLISVTHSPFVFDNQFRRSVVDVRRLKAAANG